MKMPFILTLAGLAIGFALPGLAQEQDTVAPEVRQQIEAVTTRREEAYNKYDAAAWAPSTRKTRSMSGRGCQKVVPLSVCQLS
jgi:hypothetical protein